jgi:HSP20 family protein
MTHVRFNSGNCAPARTRHQPSNSLINWFWSDLEKAQLGGTFPMANIIETKDDFRIELSVPGFMKSDFRINLDGQILSISGVVNEEGKELEETLVRHEFSKRPFTRNFRLSNWVDSTGILAKFENGILIVSIPKVEQAKSKPAMEISVD